MENFFAKVVAVIWMILITMLFVFAVIIVAGLVMGAVVLAAHGVVFIFDLAVGWL